MKRRKRSTDGFTLFEMAIVVLIMGSMAAMLAPGLSEWMADARASAAAQELVRLNRVIRVRVNDTGLAHLFVFRASDDTEGSNALGKIEVWEGMNNHCTQTPWTQTINGDPKEGHVRIDHLDLGDSAYNLPMGSSPPSAKDVGRQVVRIVPNIDEKSVVLCFEPGGNTLIGSTESESEIGFQFTPQTASVVFRVTRTIAHASGSTPEPRGVTREVIYPAGGNGRLRF